MPDVQPWWMPSIKIFVRVWGWILLPALVALGILYLAKRFEVHNGILVAIVVILGMIITFWGLWKEMKNALMK